MIKGATILSISSELEKSLTLFNIVLHEFETYMYILTEEAIFAQSATANRKWIEWSMFILVLNTSIVMHSLKSLSWLSVR